MDSNWKNNLSAGYLKCLTPPTTEVCCDKKVTVAEGGNHSSLQVDVGYHAVSNASNKLLSLQFSLAAKISEHKKLSTTFQEPGPAADLVTGPAKKDVT